ncbi:hypothetical protein GCM10011425_18130 [Mucilaginibacter galii]|uniref:Gylcosyl hydrolase 115 C-terminal domain-containing protein n=1 Tax=Mucilaginibacter galii TaxID=2005073 RepID=A0A917N166_9SPHI|nr:glycosyl hydrolase 115 family protein [Mucilaginibacter galii]GGI50601.1 hypothetical protein GCM10011425_18130 [Mucilaginibacter galii]
MFIIYSKPAFATQDYNYISSKANAGYFPLAVAGKAAPLWVSNTDYEGVIRAAKDLQTDIGAVSAVKPQMLNGTSSAKTIVIIGTIGKSPVIDQLIKTKKLNVAGITGKWETFVLQTVNNPMPGVDKALVIAGSDKRGTIYGIYDLSAQIGVSPWYWWADVPVKKQSALYVVPGRYTQGEPAVKYRGIFINDEAPAFSGWTKEKFGGVNSKMYAKMFELILRMKGNYLWPAMWGNAFNDDDPLNRSTADMYGIVMGTSHHEPMDRAQQEWKRYGKGEWDYNKNSDELRNFWKKGIENMGNAETIVTVGMRGDGDMAMEQGTNISLLEKIVKDQRQIIADVTKKPAEQTPQMWALYKEVQDYYDKGMTVPDDVTLLLCDDNWGNIRKLPKLGEKPRKGGYGIYYHYDYVGGPRNYKWLNTNQISKTWEQMHLAYEHNARQVWIVNVGDLKPMEFPIEFFLDYAWNPNKWPASRLTEYTKLWAQKQFGPQYADGIAHILNTYTKYNARRKPELLDANTYSLTNYQEFEKVVTDYNALLKQAEEINNTIPANQKDAYYQLVLHPVQACANLNEMYYNAALNKWYAKQGRAATNDKAERVKALFAKDAEISKYYNTQLAGGKWNHMMDQTHIGYTYWQQPPVDKIPDVQAITIPSAAAMGVSIEGSTDWWPQATAKAALPEFNTFQKDAHYIEVFNRGKESFKYSVNSPAWLTITPSTGSISQQQQLTVSVNWTKAPAGKQTVPVVITGSDGSKVSIDVVVNNNPLDNKVNGFVQANGYISMEAEHYTKAIGSANVKWITVPNYGKTQSGVTTFPATAGMQTPGGNSPHLQYQVNTVDTGLVEVNAYLSPTIDFTGNKGLQYAVSIDDEKPQVFYVNAEANPGLWNRSVANSINIQSSKHQLSKAGVHTVKFWMISPGIVLQKLVLDFNKSVKPSYLGPPESFQAK